MGKYRGITKLAKEAINYFNKKWEKEQKRKEQNGEWERTFLKKDYNFIHLDESPQLKMNIDLSKFNFKQTVPKK